MLALSCGRQALLSIQITVVFIYSHMLTLNLSICQVKSGTLFDNVLICDDPEYAKKFAEETWGKQKDVCIF